MRLDLCFQRKQAGHWLLLPSHRSASCCHMPRQSPAHGFAPASWGWRCSSVPPNYLPVIRSPGNRDQACWRERHFKHQKGGQTSHSGGPEVGWQKSDSQNIKWQNPIPFIMLMWRTLWLKGTIRNRSQRELRKTPFQKERQWSVSTGSVLLRSTTCMLPKPVPASSVLSFPQSSKGEVWTQAVKSPECLWLVGVVILPHKVTFPVSMNYSYILVRDMVWGIYSAFNSAIIDLLN